MRGLEPSTASLIKLAIEAASAVFGMLGTWLMARRYADPLLRSLLYAVVWPVLIIAGKADRIRQFIQAKVNANRDVPDSIADMVIGLNLLFLAFLLQFIALLMEVKK